METGKRLPWSQPSIDVRDQFLSKMQTLANRFMPVEQDTIELEVDEITENEDELELIDLLDKGEFASAFFLSRRLITRGETWAESYLVQAQEGLSADDNVSIP